MYIYMDMYMRFVFLERERASTHECERGRCREGGERIPSRLQAKHGAWCRAQSHNPGFVTWTKIESWSLNQLSHLSAPWIFLVTDVKHFCMLFLVTCVFLEKCLFKSFVLFWKGLLLSFRNFLYILDTDFSDIWFANIFSHSVSCLFTLFR